MVRTGVSPAAVDAYVVVTRGFSNVGATNQMVDGLGILGISGGLLTSDKQFVYALYGVTVIDGRQFSSISRANALLPGEAPTPLLNTALLRGPNREVDESWWPASLDASGNQRLKNAVVELIDKSLPNALQQTMLTN